MVSMIEIPDSSKWMRREIDRFCVRAKGAPKRSLCEFARAEIILPDGPHKGERLNLDRSPQMRHLLELIETGRFREHYWSACVQSGKTLALIVVLLYFLFEREESVVFGLPTMEKWADKWASDILPAIESTRYRSLLPTSGGGSRGGRPDEGVRFTNGVTLKPMSGQGRDEKRSSFTARVLVMTEVDKMAYAASSSTETDKIRQLKARTRSYGDRALVFGECTVSTEQGRIWTEITEGSDSRIAHRCPHCERFAFLEREHLVGYEQAETPFDAYDSSAYVCPRCGELWDEADRMRSIRDSLIVHRGQEIDAQGIDIAGEAVNTRTLGYRWNAAANPFTPAGEVGEEEWKANRLRMKGRDEDAQLAEIDLRQFRWTLPITKGEGDSVELTPDRVQRRMASTPHRVLPQGTRGITLGVDVQKRGLYWLVLAALGEDSTVIVDYGFTEVQSDTTPIERAIPAAIQSLEEWIVDELGGYVLDGTERRLTPAMRTIDSNFEKDATLEGVRRVNGRHKMAVAIGSRGRGTGQYADGSRAPKYRHPTKRTAQIKHIGDGFNVRYETSSRMHVVEVNADRAKKYVHERLSIPPDAPGSMLFYNADDRAHYSIARHFTAEVSVEEIDSSGALVSVFKRIRQTNHYLDAGALAVIAARLVGLIGNDPAPGWGDGSQCERAVAGPPRTAPKTNTNRDGDGRRRGNFQGPGGVPFCIADR